MMNFLMKEVENADESNPLEREEFAQESQSIGIPLATIASSNAVMSLTLFLSLCKRSLYL
jgi:hypothetical protein